jgi:hypothetical protein
LLPVPCIVALIHKRKKKKNCPTDGFFRETQTAGTRSFVCRRRVHRKKKDVDRVSGRVWRNFFARLTSELGEKNFCTTGNEKKKITVDVRRALKEVP